MMELYVLKYVLARIISTERIFILGFTDSRKSTSISFRLYRRKEIPEEDFDGDI